MTVVSSSMGREGFQDSQKLVKCLFSHHNTCKAKAVQVLVGEQTAGWLLWVQKRKDDQARQCA